MTSIDYKSIIEKHLDFNGELPFSSIAVLKKAFNVLHKYENSLIEVWLNSDIIEIVEYDYEKRNYYSRYKHQLKLSRRKAVINKVLK
jgi:hypothetical protein